MKIPSDKDYCPLCSSREIDAFFEDKYRKYLGCQCCELVFVPKKYWLSTEEEKGIYDLHENDSKDMGYRRFLSRLSIPLLKKLEKLGTRRKGLDFGCGPGPTLSALFEEQGHEMDLYDPFYYNNPEVFQKKYDFICATEVMEHLGSPDREFSALFAMLNQESWLGIMTKLVIDKHAFSTWHYIRDRTHISFYSKRTFAYLAQRFNAELRFVADDVILLKKNKD